MALFDILDLTHRSAWGDLLSTWKQKYYLPSGVKCVVFGNSTGKRGKVVFIHIDRGGVDVAWTLNFFGVLDMNGYHLYLRCPSCFELQYCLHFQVEMRWKFVSKYLHMMYEQLKKIKQVSWVLECIFPNRLYLKERPISLPMVTVSTIKRIWD